MKRILPWLLLLLLSGCLLPEQKETGFGTSRADRLEAAAVGAKEGAKTAVQALPKAFNAWEQGGIAGGALGLVLLLIKATTSGLAASKQRKLEMVAEGVRKAQERP